MLLKALGAHLRSCWMLPTQSPFLQMMSSASKARWRHLGARCQCPLWLLCIPLQRDAGIPLCWDLPVPAPTQVAEAQCDLGVFVVSPVRREADLLIRG